MNNKKNLNKVLLTDSKVFGAFFLGFGLAIFLINVSSFISLLPHIKNAGIEISFRNFAGYYLSLASSLIVMAYAMHNIMKK